MATGVVEPEDDKSVQWSNEGAGENWEDIDEYPSSPDGTEIYETTSGQVDIYYMSTIAGTYTVSQVVVYTYGYVTVEAFRPTVDVSFDDGASWEGAQTVNLPTLTPGETTNTFSGLNYDQDDLANFLVKYTSYTDNKNYANWIDRCYVVVTYTEVGWDAGDVMGVANEDIDEVSGVGIEDIDEVKGV